MFPPFGSNNPYGFSNAGFNTGGGLTYSGIDTGIANFEGFNLPGSRAARNNNPGNIQYGPFAQNYGAIGSDSNGFAIFPDTNTGFGATDALVGNYASQGLSLRQLINKWNPPGASGNSQQINQNYVGSISQQTGINPDAPIAGQSSMFGAGLGAIGDGILGSIPFLGPLYNGAKLFGSATGLNPLASFSWGRIAAFILGMILIAGGLYMFKPVAEVVNRTVKDSEILAA